MYLVPFGAEIAISFLLLSGSETGRQAIILYVHISFPTHAVYVQIFPNFSFSDLLTFLRPTAFIVFMP